jgi:23S rRNA (adenine2503-C2)-methyltransferase
MTTRELFQLSISQVTVSTIAPTPNSFKAFSEAPCVIAWSVYAANDEVRKQLVPTTKFSMHELRQGLIDSLLDSPMNDRHAILEVELMEGINDSIKEVDELAAFTKVVLDSVPGSKVVINIIPFNDTGHGEYRQPKKKNVISFQQRLQSYGLCVRIHATQGQVKLNNVDS